MKRIKGRIAACVFGMGVILMAGAQIAATSNVSQSSAIPLPFCNGCQQATNTLCYCPGNPDFTSTCAEWLNGTDHCP